MSLKLSNVFNRLRAKTITMNYEAFKLAVIEMAVKGWQYYPQTNLALLTVWRQGHAGATSEEILRLAYSQYCRNHGITEQP